MTRDNYGFFFAVKCKAFVVVQFGGQPSAGVREPKQIHFSIFTMCVVNMSEDFFFLKNIKRFYSIIIVFELIDVVGMGIEFN